MYFIITYLKQYLWLLNNHLTYRLGHLYKIKESSEKMLLQQQLVNSDMDYMYILELKTVSEQFQNDLITEIRESFVSMGIY